MATTQTELLINGNVVATRNTAPFLNFGYTIQSSDISANATVAVREYIDGSLAGTTPVVNGVIEESGSVTPILPSDVAEMDNWIKGTSDESMTFYASSVEIDEWADKISANVFTSDSQSVAPQWSAASNAVSFGNSRNISSPPIAALSVNNDWHVFFLIRNDITPNNYWFVSTINSSDRFGCGVRSGKITIGNYDGSNFIAKGGNFSDTSANYHIIEAKKVSGVVTAWLNGNELTENTNCPTTTEIEASIGDSILGGDQTDFAFKEFFNSSQNLSTATSDGLIAYLESVQ